MKTRAVYFSATYTTRKVVEHVAQRLSDEVTLYYITNDADTTEIIVPQDELLIVGIPVYAGRVPAMAIERIKRFKGEGTRAVALAIYGNRDYDDALLELSDLLSENNFLVISAGAFIAQHSIFPKVGANRPDAEDYKLMDDFADETLTILGKENRELLPIHIRGNRQYGKNRYENCRGVSVGWGRLDAGSNRLCFGQSRLGWIFHWLRCKGMLRSRLVRLWI